MGQNENIGLKALQGIISIIGNKKRQTGSNTAQPSAEQTEIWEQAYQEFMQNRKPSDAWQEQHARKLFPFETMSPEEYAAREAVNWGCFNAHKWRYQDKKLDAWILRLKEIFRTPGLVEKYQKELLTPRELRAIRKRSKEDF